MEVKPGIHRIETLLGGRLNALYLLVGDEHALLVDTGVARTPHEAILPYLDSIGLTPDRIRYVVITHADFDHMGGAAALRQIVPTAAFLCHVMDRPWIERTDRLIDENYGQFRVDHGIDETDEAKAFIRANAQGTPIDIGVTGGETIRLGTDWSIEVLHTAGHTRGHLSVYDAHHRTAIITDTALWHGLVTKDGAPAFPPTYRFVDSYLSSIQRLQGLPIDTLLTSHYPVQSGPAVAAFLGESRAYADRVEAALRDELTHAETPRTMRELITALGPRLGDWADATMLAYPLAGHLERLAQYGLVVSDRRGAVVTWRWVD